jgi:hypothetical protein
MTIRGWQCKLYVDVDDDFEAPSWVEAADVVDAKLELSHSEVDSSHRGAGGIEVTEPGLLQARITGQMLGRNLPAGASPLSAYELLRQAFVNRFSVLVRALTGASTDEDARGVWGYFNVLSFTSDQPLNDLVKVDFVLASSAQRGGAMYVDFDQGDEEVAAQISEQESGGDNGGEV